jgi:hypothetical protein
MAHLCNGYATLTAISSTEDLPFHADGNSHKYVLTDQYKLLISKKMKKNLFLQPTTMWFLVFGQWSTTAACSMLTNNQIFISN